MREIFLVIFKTTNFRANLFLLIPKLEVSKKELKFNLLQSKKTVVKMMREDASISEFFKMLTIEKSCMGHAVV